MMIEVKEISKTFGDIPAVRKVSFNVNEGETLVLLGTSGSGKTTMLRMINRLTEPDSGTIKINGEDITLKPAEVLRRSIGYVLQSYGLFPHYTVEENIAVVPKLLNWPEEKIKIRIRELLQKLQIPLEKYGHVYPASLSGGQKQRVGLARALAADPPILLMDEPFGALDPLTRESVRKEFMELDELKKKTIILVTHDVNEAFQLGNQICLMDKGKLLQKGSGSDLLFSPANNFVKNFFAQQKLQLELRTISVKSIWNELPPGQETNSLSLKSDQNLWELMESISDGKSSATVFDPETKTLKSVSFNDIQAALISYKKQS